MSFDLKKTKVLNLKKEAENLIQDEAERQIHAEHKKNLESSKSIVDGKIKRLSWIAPEYEVYEKSTLWYFSFGIILLAIVVYAMITESPIMAITFILIGMVGYIFLQKEPRDIEFVVNYEGVRAGRELYDYENIESFWINYDPPHTKTLTLHTNAAMMPFVHIPIGNNDPVKLREVLIDFVPEVKQDPSFMDALERFLHI